MPLYGTLWHTSAVSLARLVPFPVLLHGLGADHVLGDVGRPRPALMLLGALGVGNHLQGVQLVRDPWKLIRIAG